VLLPSALSVAGKSVAPQGGCFYRIIISASHQTAATVALLTQKVYTTAKCVTEFLLRVHRYRR